MSTWQKIRYILAIIAQSICAAWLSIAIYFIARYYMDTENPLRHEYWFGVWISGFYSAGFSVGSAFLAASVRKSIPRAAFRLLTIPALIIGLSLILMLLGSIIYQQSLHQN